MSKMSAKLSLACALCVTTVGLSAAIPEDVGGSLLFDIGEADSPYAYGAVIEGSTGVRKTGVGTLKLTGANTFTGPLEVLGGTLSSSSALSTGLGNPSSVTVGPNATLDLSETGSAFWTARFGAEQPVTISGSGANGAGAIRRTSGTRYYLASDVKLADDATVVLGSGQTTGFVNLDLQGHELTISGAGALRTNGGSITPGEAGGITLGSSAYFQGGTVFGGSSNNVFRMTGAGTKLEMNWLSNPIPWTLSVEESVTLASADGNNNRWNGPVTIAEGKTLTINSPASKVVVLNGPVEGNGLTVDGNGSTVYLNGGLKLKGTLKTNAATPTIKVSGGDGENTLNSLVTYGGSLSLANLGRLDVKSILQLRGYSWTLANVVLTNTTLVCGMSCSVADDNSMQATFRVESDASLTAPTLDIATPTTVQQTGKVAVGALYQAGGDVSVTGATHHLAGGVGSYGYYGLEGGTLTLGGDFILSNWGYAAFVQEAGTCSGGALKVTSKGGDALIWQKGGTMSSRVNLGTENSSAAAQSVLAVEGAGTVFKGEFEYKSYDVGANGIVVVNDGAVFQVGRFSRSWLNDWITPESGLYLLSDGGILKPSFAWGWANAEANRRPTAIVVQAKGVTCDTSLTAASGESSMTIPFVAPEGRIVKAVSLPTDEAFASDVFLGPPRIRIVGSGVGAVAAAVFDSKTRKVTGIRVLSAGTGYDEDTTAVMESANRTATYACAVITEPAPTTSVGFTKTGAGRLDLSGANTWKGPTKVDGGTLKIVNQTSLPTGSSVSVASGATLDLGGRTHVVPSVSGAGSITGSLRVTNALEVAVGSATPLAISGKLTLDSGTTIAVTGVPDADSVPEGTKYSLLTANGGVTYGTGLIVTGVPEAWRLRLKGNGIFLGLRSGLSVIVR